MSASWLFVAASISVAEDVVTFFFPGITERQGDCLLASGYNPFTSGAARLANTGFSKQIDACEGARPSSYWQAPLLTCAMLVSAYLLYRLLPRWKARRSRYVPVDDVDTSGVIQSLLDVCVEKAGRADRGPRHSGVPGPAGRPARRGSEPAGDSLPGRTGQGIRQVRAKRRIASSSSSTPSPGPSGIGSWPFLITSGSVTTSSVRMIGPIRSLPTSSGTVPKTWAAAEVPIDVSIVPPA